LAKYCNSLKAAQKQWGTICGKLVMKRLDDIRDSDNLMVLQKVPQARCHPLKGDMAGFWSLDVEHPYRLLIEPADEKLPMTPDGRLDAEAITAVRVIGVRDTHG